MSNNEQSRIDRLEALAQQILHRTDSNAKSIEALTNEWQKDRQEWKKDRTRLYEAMSRMAATQSTFWQIQADY